MDIIELLTKLSKDSQEKTTGALTAIEVLEKLEQAAYLCGDMIMIPKKTFYDLVSEAVD